jgi:hypothetical protein
MKNHVFPKFSDLFSLIAQKVTGQEQYVNYGGADHQSVTEQDAASYYSTHQQQHEEQPLDQQQQQQATTYTPYPLSDAYSTEAQQQQPHQQQMDSYLAVYGPNGAYADALSATVAVGMDNGMQSVDAFVAYT